MQDCHDLYRDVQGISLWFYYLVLIACAACVTGVSRDELVLTSGTEIGALLVDGLGDGVAIECPSEDLDFLRTMSFGLLQVLLSCLTPA